MADIVDFDAVKARPYIEASIESFLGDPPDSDYQRGYLASLLDVYEECLGQSNDLSKKARVLIDMRKEEAVVLPFKAK